MTRGLPLPSHVTRGTMVMNMLSPAPSKRVTFQVAFLRLTVPLASRSMPLQHSYTPSVYLDTEVVEFR